MSKKRNTISLLLLLPIIIQAQSNVFTIARPVIASDTTLKKSDILFSSRWSRGAYYYAKTLNPVTGGYYETFDALKSFYATRLEWSYIYRNSEKDTYIQKVKDLGISFSGALTTFVGDNVNGEGSFGGGKTIGRVVDINNTPYLSCDWLPNLPWGCSANSDFRALFLAHAKKLVDFGIDRIQVDGMEFNLSALAWGGCYCPTCIAGIRAYIKSHRTANEIIKMGIVNIDSFNIRTFLLSKQIPALRSGGIDKWTYYGVHPWIVDDVTSFQTEELLEFFQDVRTAIDTYAGKHIVFSCNGSTDFLNLYYQRFDFAISEWGTYDPISIHKMISEFSKINKTILMTYAHHGLKENRLAIASAYACGGHMMVPWDVYVYNQARLFGQPGEYADLFGFITANKQYFDKYEDAGILTAQLKDERYPAAEQPIRIEGSKSTQVHATIRAIPDTVGMDTKTVVVHLIDMADVPESFIISINPNKFFGNTPLKVELIMPEQYNAAKHYLAIEQKDYSGLTKKLIYSGTNKTEFTIPALTPRWAILLVSKGKDDGGVCQPYISVGSSKFSESTSVTITSGTTGARIYYTIDGTIPTEASSEYLSPLTITKSCILKTVAIASGNTSEPAIMKMEGDPIISSNPVSPAPVCIGGILSPLTITVLNGTTNYQWYSNTRNDNRWGTLLTGATDSSYTPSTTIAGTLYYYCNISISGTHFIKSSNTATVKVVPDPFISVNPVSPSPVDLGETVSPLKVTAENGTPELTYQWYSNTTNSSTGGIPITGATSVGYPPPTTSAGTIYYYCLVSAAGSGCNVDTSTLAIVNTMDKGIGISAEAKQFQLLGLTLKKNEIQIIGNLGRNSSATLYDFQGRVLLVKMLDEGNLNLISTPNLKTGIYLISIEDSGKMQNFKVFLPE